PTRPVWSPRPCQSRPCSGACGGARSCTTLAWRGNGRAMAVRVDRMMLGDVPEVMAIERESFTAPWPASAYRRELIENRMAHYYVLRLSPPPPVPDEFTAPVLPGRRNLLSALLPRVLRHDGPTAPRRITLAGYAGLWLMVDEAHITTIGVRPQFRGRGYGELLLVALVEAALDINARWLTMEVRVC